jgi:hypothetical protein
MPIALAILAAVLCAYASLWIAVLWIGERIGRRWSGADTGRADALFKPKGRLAVHQTFAPFIAMPDQLQTRDEMVAWMTKELPKLAVGKHKHIR